jgi:hypothetical protein
MPASLQGQKDWDTTISIAPDIDVGLPTVAVIVVDQIPVSNFLVVDNPTALTAMLGARHTVDSPTDGLPSEGIDSAMGQYVAWLRGSTDFSGLSGLEGSGVIHQPGHRIADVDDADDPIPDDLELTILKRRGQRWGATSGGRLDDLLAALALLGAEIPASRRPRLVHAMGGETPTSQHPFSTPTPSASRRLGNVLDKMCRGAVDRRLFDRDPDTSIKNVVSLIEGLWVLDSVNPCNTWLSPDRRRALLSLLLRGMLGTETVTGLISSLDEDERGLAIANMADAPELVGDLFLSALDPDGKALSSLVFDWQPLLKLALSLGVARGRTKEERLRLVRLAEFMDDEHWQERTRNATKVEFELSRDGGTWIDLIGNPDGLFDSDAVAKVIGAWFSYEHPALGERLGLRFRRPGSDRALDKWRVSLIYGAECYASWPGDASSVVSAERLSQNTVDGFADGRLTLRWLFPNAPDRKRASA